METKQCLEKGTERDSRSHRNMTKREKKEREHEEENDSRLKRSGRENDTHTKKKILSGLVVELLGRERQRQQGQSLTVSSELAEPRVSALCGSTESCHPAQHGDCDKTSEPIKPHLRC